MKCVFCNPTYLKGLVAGTENWKAYLDYDQNLLGSCIVVSNTHVEDLSNLNEEDWKDLRSMIRLLEGAVKVEFGATLFNWICAPNHSFLKKPYSPHIRWYFKPRYEHQKHFEGHDFSDKNFGHSYHVRALQESNIPLDIRESIRKKLHSRLSQSIL